MIVLGRLRSAMVGPGGWRSVIAPLSFALVGIALLVYDHLNQRVPALVFWLTLGLIVTVFLRMLETNRRQSRALAQQRREAVNDQVTGLRNRSSLEADIGAAAAAPGGGWVLVLLELEGLEAHNDQLGYTAGDELLRRAARQLAAAVVPLGGIAYRVTASRLAVLVPTGDRELGEIVLIVTGSLRSDYAEAPLGSSYGEVTIPGEAADAEAAFQIAGRRLATHRQRRHRSARRQAHAALMAALDARHPELRGRFAVIHRRLQVPVADALERAARNAGVELPDAALPLAVASGAMQIGLALERLTQPDVVDEALGVRMSRLLRDEIERGKG